MIFISRPLEFASIFWLLALALVATACAPGDDAGDETGDEPRSILFSVEAGEPYPDVEEEVHLRNVRQLTFEGENAEAYFSFDGTKLVFQRSPPEGGCDQIFTYDLATGDTTMVSTGEGRTTCSYYYPSGDRILYSSTHHEMEACPAPPDFSRGYVWPVYESYDIFVTDPRGSEHVQLTDVPGYDAEATFSPTGERIIFTSSRHGDLDLYTMNSDGSDVTRMTREVGYDGGAFFSPDGSKIVWRAHYPESEEEVADYRSLLRQGLIRPSTLDIYVMDATGRDKRRITDNEAANFGPYWHPDGDRILFSSNMDDPDGREFDIYMIDLDGDDLERVTFTGGFDGFPVFSPDGRHFVWGSNRNPSHEGNTNIFIAEWVELPEGAATEDSADEG